jgi:quercetin dioxygenase-like cupin family protein
MSNDYTHITDLTKEVVPPNDGILTRTLFQDEEVKAVIFGFGKGEELSEHTASMPAILHFIQGDATLTLEDDVIEARERLDHVPPDRHHDAGRGTGQA